MSTLQDEFNNLLAEQRQLTAKFQAIAQEMFKGLTKEFFVKNPGITAVRWTQYTPYFNDGDECVFSVNTPYVTNCPLDQLDDLTKWGEYEGDDENIFSINNITWVMETDSSYWQKDKKLINALVAENQIDVQSVVQFTEAIVDSEMEDIMRATFGDHVMVTATRDGFDVEECDHD